MYPDAFIQYLVHFHGDRDYFECHEILEEYWKDTNEGKNSIWVGFILLAVSNYHFRRGNIEGASRTLKKALRIFHDQTQKLSELGMNWHRLTLTLKERIIEIETGKSYSSFSLPIKDSELVKKCQNICLLNGFTWGEISNLENHNLINRHITRDRSDVIIERQNAIANRHEKGRE